MRDASVTRVVVDDARVARLLGQGEERELVLRGDVAGGDVDAGGAGLAVGGLGAAGGDEVDAEDLGLAAALDDVGREAHGDAEDVVAGERVAAAGEDAGVRVAGLDRRDEALEGGDVEE